MSREQKKQAIQIARDYISEREACRVFGLHRTVFRRPKSEKDVFLRDKIREIARKKRRYGYRRICEKLNKQHVVNHKKVYRLYREMDLKYRIKTQKKRYCGEPVPLLLPETINERWSMDFVTDRLYDSRKFRVFNLIDDCSRESIVQHADFSISGVRLVRIFDDLKNSRPLPKQIVCDNGPEFTSKAFRIWADKNSIELHFIEKGKPTQNAFVESFNGKFRDECLNEELFLNIGRARSIIESWRIEYNSERPHSGLNGLTPYEFIAKTA